MAKSLKYYTLPKSKVTIWEKPLKAGGVFYYLYLDQTQILSSQVDEVVKIIRERLPNSAVMGKKTAKTYQISYSLPNGEKAQGVDETMLEFVDDKLQEFGYDDTKNQAVSTRGKKMIGTYAKPTQSSVDLKVGDKFRHTSGTYIWEIVEIEGDKVTAKSETSTKEFSKERQEELIAKGDLELIRTNPTPSSIVWRVGDKFYHKSHPTNIFEIQSIIGDDVIILLPDNKTTVDYKISAVGDFFREGNWVLTQPPVSTPYEVGDQFYTRISPKYKYNITVIGKKFVEYFDEDGGQHIIEKSDLENKLSKGELILEKKTSSTTPPVSQPKVPEIKQNQFYIDFENYGGLLLIDKVEPHVVILTENINGKLEKGLVIAKKGFDEKISDGKLKLYVPQGGDEWTRIDYTTLKEDSVFRVLTNAKGKVEYAVYDSQGTYVMTDNDDEYTFKKYLLNNSFHLTTPLQSLQEKKSEQKVETEKYETKYSEKSKLKKELKDLVELKDLISDLDFEDKVNVSTLITKTQNKINDIIAKEVEKKIGDTKIFEELFEQSFTPLQSRYDMKMEKNDLVELVAPNGDMSDLNEDVTNLVNSELFKEWFGDFKTAYFYRNLPDFGGVRVSKVLSEKFEPLVVWHGTGKQFSYFRFDNFPAAYFAVNRKYSDFFAKNNSEDGVGYVLPFFININNPLDLSSFGIDKVSPKDFFDWMYLKTGMTPEELEVNPMLLDNTFPDAPIWMYLRNNPTMIKKIADMGVYDGMKFYEFVPNIDPSDEAYSTLAYITFDPHQSKLADPDRGQILLASLKSFMLEKGGSI